MTIERPEDTYAEDYHRFRWPDGVEMVLERFMERKDDVSCELTVSYEHPTKGGALFKGRLLLMGPGSRRDVRVALERRDADPDWGAMLEQACALSLSRIRQGEPILDLAAITSDAPRYLIRPFVFDRAMNVIYGDGASSKSILALAMGLAVATGEPVSSIESEDTGRVLYLDWEDDPETHAERLRALCQGAGITLSDGMVLYQRMNVSLPECARDVRKAIVEHNVRMVIVDSVGMACGGDPNDAATLIKTMVAARSLQVPVIAVHHIGKDAKDKSKPYGSVYASNETRSSWLVEKQQDEGSDELRVAMTNQKTNRSRVAPRQAFSVRFTNEADTLRAITIQSLTFSQSDDVGTVSQKAQVVRVLREYGATTVKALAASTGLSTNRLRAILNGSVGDLFIKLDEGGGRSNEARWGLLDTNRTDVRGETAPIFEADFRTSSVFTSDLISESGPLRGPDGSEGEADEESPF